MSARPVVPRRAHVHHSSVLTSTDRDRGAPQCTLLTLSLPNFFGSVAVFSMFSSKCRIAPLAQLLAPIAIKKTIQADPPHRAH
ncbi:hypothetical protein A0H81_09495 [Grifola frondosa]|uniref:Uncharacterized protein n=1 Tax=Grifola frondosa TaxID=5627 RepID=A0A1C7LKD6_GRIFR|nr:hypothetical protein A0H81_14800 [Grifola frondosa]OBZ70995.1 hypothetical protein A0H81_09495 [Grifola frondosa]